jgi:hypothetical protein
MALPKVNGRRGCSTYPTSAANLQFSSCLRMVLFTVYRAVTCITFASLFRIQLRLWITRISTCTPSTLFRFRGARLLGVHPSCVYIVCCVLFICMQLWCYTQRKTVPVAEGPWTFSHCGQYACALAVLDLWCDSQSFAASLICTVSHERSYSSKRFPSYPRESRSQGTLTI